MDKAATFHDLEGKSVFITGGGSGIGAALTEGFLEQGADVAFVQRSDATGFCDAMEKKHGKRPMFQPCDVTDVAALQDAVAKASEANGAIGVLVNNAANDERHATGEVTEEYWDWCQSINLKPYFFGCQAVLAGMKRNGGGAIVNFSSISYMMGNGGYPGANAGITGLTRSLARDHGGDGIRVNAIAPGWVLTERQVELWGDPGDLARHLDRQCIKEHLAPGDIVGAVLFMASDASRMMTGQVVVVDGGVVATG